ncbi:MAG: hypothetical protein ACKOAC_04980 [Fluviibacter sp.]
MTHQMTKIFTDDLLEQETRMSSLIDGESSLPPDSLLINQTEIQQYYHYQLIRQTMRGVVMTSGAHETGTWSKTRFTQFWAHVDARTEGKKS